MENGNSEIYIPRTSPEGEFSKYTNEIEKLFKSKKNGIIENSEIKTLLIELAEEILDRVS